MNNVGWLSPFARPSRIPIPRDAGGRFVNWARSVTSSPTSWLEPTDEAQLQAAVAAAARAGKRVRVVGSGHSWSAVAAPVEVAVSLDGCAGLLSVDREGGTATAWAGTRLCDLNAALAAQGLALPIVGSIAHQSLAGAIATGTHGSSLAHGNLASLVTALRIVTGNGEVLDLHGGDPRLDGARVHLGALGIVTQLTLRVVPAFHLAETVEALPLATALATLPAIARSAEYVKVWWMPHTSDALVFRYARTTEPATRRPSARTLRWVDEVVLQGRVFPLVVAVQARAPQWIPGINGLVARTLAKPRTVGPSALMLSTPMPLRHRETEAAVALEQSSEALDRLVRLIARERLRINFIAEARFVPADANWLSPANGRDTCQLGAYTTEVPDAERYIQGFWREMRPLGARPHWGKEHDHAAPELAPLYPAWAHFRALRDALDPRRTFASPWTRHALGD